MVLLISIFLASVCAGTTSKKNRYQQCVMYRYYFLLTVALYILNLDADF